MTEFEIFHLSNQIFINNAIYTVAVILMTALSFCLIRRSRELNSPLYGKLILTLFCSFPILLWATGSFILVNTTKKRFFSIVWIKRSWGTNFNHRRAIYCHMGTNSRRRSRKLWSRCTLNSNVWNYFHSISCWHLGENARTKLMRTYSCLLKWIFKTVGD